MLIDTGPLVSLLSPGLNHHPWALSQWQRLQPPVLNCEPVLTEAAFVLRRAGKDCDPHFALLDCGVIQIGIGVQEETRTEPTCASYYRAIATVRCPWPMPAW